MAERVLFCKMAHGAFNSTQLGVELALRGDGGVWSTCFTMSLSAPNEIVNLQMNVYQIGWNVYNHPYVTKLHPCEGEACWWIVAYGWGALCDLIWACAISKLHPYIWHITLTWFPYLLSIKVENGGTTSHYCHHIVYQYVYINIGGLLLLCILMLRNLMRVVVIISGFKDIWCIFQNNNKEMPSTAPHPQIISLKYALSVPRVVNEMYYVTYVFSLYVCDFLDCWPQHEHFWRSGGEQAWTIQIPSHTCCWPYEQNEEIVEGGERELTSTNRRTSHPIGKRIWPLKVVHDSSQLISSTSI